MILVAAARRWLFPGSQARQAMAKAKAMLDQALESMVSGFVLLDQRHRVVHWNRRLPRSFRGWLV